jgi:hypothetical protein
MSSPNTSPLSPTGSISLAQTLAEMDQALADEIQAQKTRANIKHSAFDGQLISDGNGQYIYQFKLVDPWEPQDDTPLHIATRGTEDIACTVVASTGNVLTIATTAPLSPSALKQIDLYDDATALLEKLREVLKQVDEGPAQLGSKTFGLLPYQTMQGMLHSGDFGKNPPRANQRIAAQMALGGEVTYIVGPPGTGKTVTLAAVAFRHLQEGRSVLIAAHTNIAVDNAIMKLSDICKEAGKASLLDDGRVVRYGAVQKRELKEDKYKEVYLPGIIEKMDSAKKKQRDAVDERLQQVKQQLADLPKQKEAAEKSLQEEQVQLRAQHERDRNELGALEAVVQQQKEQEAHLKVLLHEQEQ